MKLEIKYKRIGDNTVCQLINGKPVAIFKFKSWQNNLMSIPDTTHGSGHTNKFQRTQYEYEGNWD